MKMKIFKNILMFFMYFIYQIITSIIIAIFNIDVNNFNNIEKNIFMILIDLFYLIFVLIIYRKELLEDLKDFKENGMSYIIKYIPMYILGLFLMGISNSIIYEITNTQMSNNEELIRNYIKIFPIYMSFSTVIYAPIVEEITFRKTFRNIIDRKWFFILLSGIMFGLIHITTSSTTFNDYLLSIPYILMGIVFAYIYYKSNNIFTTISLHSMHNLCLLIIQFIGG